MPCRILPSYTFSISCADGCQPCVEMVCIEDSSLWILRQLILLIMDKEIDVFISYSRKDYVDERQIPIEGNR